MAEKKNILICPLDWGLGHATRCIPIIRQLSEKHQVFIASSSGAAELLKQEFPELKHFSLPPYRVTYPVRRSMSFHMALQLPSIYSTIVQEKKVVNKIISEEKIDLLISDNRFGAYSKNISSVFITHQVNIKTPYLNKIVNRLNHKTIKKFTQCWIPDFEIAPGLAGELSHLIPENIHAKYIGPLSRFSFSHEEKIYDITVVLSGPEPQRTMLEDILFKQLFELENLKINFIRGVYKDNESDEIKNIRVFDHLPASELEKILHQSKNIICRSGYSGIMDLQYFDANVLLIPTPQQTEQEYLGKLHAKDNCVMQKQGEVSVAEFLKIEFSPKKEMKGEKTDFIKLTDELFH